MKSWERFSEACLSRAWGKRSVEGWGRPASPPREGEERGLPRIPKGIQLFSPRPRINFWLSFSSVFFSLFYWFWKCVACSWAAGWRVRTFSGTSAGFSAGTRFLPMSLNSRSGARLAPLGALLRRTRSSPFWKKPFPRSWSASAAAFASRSLQNLANEALTSPVWGSKSLLIF